MQLNITTIFIIFSLITTFKYAQAVLEKLPDEGRLDVGKCLKEYFRQHPDSNVRAEIPVEDFLQKFCPTARKDPLRVEHMYNTIRKKGFERQTIDECLGGGNHANQLSVRYKNAAMQMLSDLEQNIKSHAKESSQDQSEMQIFSGFTRVAVGVCLENDLVLYKNLSEEDQKKTFTCLQNCAVKLFVIIEDLIRKEIDALEKYENQKRLGEEKESEPEKSQSDQKSPDPHKIEFVEKADKFISECNEENIHTIKDMSKIGEKWLKGYDKLFEKIYRRYHDPPFKYRVADTLENYLNCDKWICAMADYHDRPFRKWIEDENAKIYVTPLEERLFDWS